MSVAEQTGDERPEGAERTAEEQSRLDTLPGEEITASTAEEGDVDDDLDDMEFMLDEIENRIAPLA